MWLLTFDQIFRLGFILKWKQASLINLTYSCRIRHGTCTLVPKFVGISGRETKLWFPGLLVILHLKDY
jgi:hypothetical protein